MRMAPRALRSCHCQTTSVHVIHENKKALKIRANLILVLKIHRQQTGTHHTKEGRPAWMHAFICHPQQSIVPLPPFPLLQSKWVFISIISAIACPSLLLPRLRTFPQLSRLRRAPPSSHSSCTATWSNRASSRTRDNNLGSNTPGTR